MDSIVLYGPRGASPLQLGSYLQADPGPDYGEKGHIEPHFAETPALPGGQTLYSQTHIRKMTFPLMVASGGVVGLGLRQLESLIRANAVQGGYVDVQPFSVPSSEAVRFDILAGQWEPAFNIRINELGRMQGNLMLQTQPYGYWPTWITLGSAASIGMPGFLPVSGGSVFGDAPGYGQLLLGPTAFGSPYMAGSMFPDALLWSARTTPSFLPLLQAGSWAIDVGGSVNQYLASAGAPGPTAVQLSGFGNPSAWAPQMFYTIPAALEQSYRGRFHAFAFARLAAGGLAPVNWLLSLDSVGDANGGAPLASQAVVATVPYDLVASGAHQFISLGNLSLPPVGSGLSQAVRLRLWGIPGNSQNLEFGGVYLLPIDQPAGIITAGVAVPTTALGSTGRLALDSYERSAFISSPTGTLDQRLPVVPAINYRGALPVIGSSFSGVDLLGLGRISGYGWLYRAEVMSDLPDHLYSFQASSFPTMIDYVGGLTGSWGSLGGVLGQVATGIRYGSDDGGVYASAPQSAPTGQGFIPIGSAHPPASSVILYWASQWTAEFWMTPNQTNASSVLVAAGPASVATDSGWSLVYSAPSVGIGQGQPSAAVIFGLGGGDTLVGLTPGNSLTHVAAQWNAASKTMSLYLNGTLAASKTAAGSYKASTASVGLGVLGWIGSAVGGYKGAFDDLAIYPTVISASRIAAHYAAGASGNWSAATSNPLYQPIAAQAAIRFRPAFSFLKGL